jgi:hypothetical protein
VFTDSTPSSNLSVSYSANGSSIHVISTKNGTNFDDITVSENCDWVTTLSPSLSGTYYYIPFNLTENTSTSSRSCDVKVTQGESGKDITVTITQEGKVVVEKTDITAKFCGEYESKEWYIVNGNCEMPQAEQIIKSDVSYKIIGGDDEVLKHIVIYAYAVKYHYGKHIEWQEALTPTSRIGDLNLINFEGEGELIASGLCDNYEQAQKIYYWSAELASGTDKYKLSVDDRVNKDCDESGGDEPEPEKKLVSEINVLNNCLGTINIEYTGPTGGKENKTLDAKSSEKFKLPMYGQTNVQISIPKESYNKDTSNFVFVSFLDENGYPLSIPSLETNVHAEGDGVKVTPIVTNMGSTETSVCATNTQYNVCATILYEAKG